MDVSENSALKNKIAESIVSNDFAAFKKHLAEAVAVAERSLVEKYSKELKERLNG